MLLTIEHCEGFCPNYATRRTLRYVSPPPSSRCTLIFVPLATLNLNAAMCVLPQNQDYYVFDHHNAALRRVLFNIVVTIISPYCTSRYVLSPRDLRGQNNLLISAGC